MFGKSSEPAIRLRSLEKMTCLWSRISCGDGSIMFTKKMDGPQKNKTIDFEASKKLRVLIFHPALAPYRVDLFNGLAEYLDLKVIFLRKNLLNQKFNQDDLRARLKCGYDYLCSGLDIGARSFRWGVGREISRFRPDVVVCTEYSPITIYIALLKHFLLKRRYSLAIMTDDNQWICKETKFLRRFARSFVMRISDGIIVTNETTKSWYVSKYRFPSKKVGVCPIIQKENHYLRMLQAASPTAECYIRDYNLVGKRVLLFVGRLVEVKGIDRAIKAFAEIVKSIPDAVFVIVGDGPEKDSLEALAASKGIGDSIRFVGRFEGGGLLAWYLVGQLFVLASSSETYGAVVNEALLAGMPVLCSSKAGAADLIQKGGDGNVFDPYDVSALSEQMKNMLAAISPLQNRPLSIRKSLMPISFEDAVRGFVEAVENAAQGRHQE